MENCKIFSKYWIYNFSTKRQTYFFNLEIPLTFVITRIKLCIIVFKPEET
jgi:hypothetical protein